MWMVDSFTRLVYTRIYEDDANAVLWLSTICLAIHPIRDFPRCSLCQVKMTGHWPIGGGSGGHTTNLRRGHSSHILVQKITQATLPVASVTLVSLAAVFSRFFFSRLYGLVLFKFYWPRLSLRAEVFIFFSFVARGNILSNKRNRYRCTQATHDFKKRP